MGKGREIATGADRALFRNYRMHAPVEHVANQLDHFAANSAEAEREHVCPQQHHCAHLGFRKWRSDSAGVATDKVQLKLA